VVSELGYDVEEIDAEIAADNKRADELRLQLDSDPRTEMISKNVKEEDDKEITE
jgi:capsid protein